MKPKEKLHIPCHTRGKATAERAERQIERKERARGKRACKDTEG
jgi:hypothetical protein